MYMLRKEAHEALAASAQLIEFASLTIALNIQLRSEAADLRAHAKAIRRRAFRFRPMSGASDAGDGERVRALLREFCYGLEQPRSFVGPSRGSVCQACGSVIQPNELEYDIVAGTAELRLDLACYRIFEIAREDQEKHQKSA